MSYDLVVGSWKYVGRRVEDGHPQGEQMGSRSMLGQTDPIDSLAAVDESVHEVFGCIECR